MKKVIVAAVAALFSMSTVALADLDGGSDAHPDIHQQEFEESVFGKKVTPRSEWVLHRWKKDPCQDDKNWQKFGCHDSNEVDLEQLR